MDKKNIFSRCDRAFKKIPFHQTAKAHIYQDDMKALKENPNIKNIVGHSLGGSVALQILEDYPGKNYKVETYGAPVLSIEGDKNRHRYFGGPVSMFDRGAETEWTDDLNKHSFGGFVEKAVKDEKTGEE